MSLSLSLSRASVQSASTTRILVLPIGGPMPRALYEGYLADLRRVGSVIPTSSLTYHAPSKDSQIISDTHSITQRSLIAQARLYLDLTLLRFRCSVFAQLRSRASIGSAVACCSSSLTVQWLQTRPVTHSCPSVLHPQCQAWAVRTAVAAAVRMTTRTTTMMTR
jgi:hypothetical protein